MTDHLNPDERARLDQIAAALAKIDQKAAPLKRERATILGRARQRKFYASR